MKTKLLNISPLILSFSIISCNSGGSSGESTQTENIQVSSPSKFTLTPRPSEQIRKTGYYKSVSISKLTQPNQSSTGILANQYPESYYPTFTNQKSLNIAHGYTEEQSVAKISALVTIGSGGICSATPVKYDAQSNTTFLIGAAHCFVKDKDKPNTLAENNLKNLAEIQVHYGSSYYDYTTLKTYSVKKIYIPQTYCDGGTFTSDSFCQNFSPVNGTKNGQGNDIAVIAINGEFGGTGNSINYPQVVPESEYPDSSSHAPILSTGYGINTQTPQSNSRCLGGNCAILNYVAGNYYMQQDATGYHYLHHSYSNTGAFNQTGYTSLICGGDSGGGDLFWTGEKWILLSEHTYGPSGACGSFFDYLPNGATNVSKYYDWIMEIMNNGQSVN